MHFTRESIFAGAIRSFCGAFSTIVGALLAVAFVIVGVLALSGTDYYPPKPEATLLPNAQGNRDLLPLTSPALLQINLHGVVGMGDFTSDKINNILLESREDLLKGDRLKGILLHIDTPGGTVTGADDIYRTLLNYKAKYNIPIYAYVDGLCASGGMYIACAADKIFASPSSVIGSVGVIMGPNFNFSDAMIKLGISSLTITEGKDKDELNPFRPWKPNEDASLKAITSAMYDRFVNIVTSARPRMSRQKLVEEYGAHVFAAKEAEALGYVDVGGCDYDKALTDLATAAGIGEKENYQLVLLSPPQPLFPQIAQSLFKRGKIVHTFEFSPLFSPELSGKLLYLYNP